MGPDFSHRQLFYRSVRVGATCRIAESAKYGVCAHCLVQSGRPVYTGVDPSEFNSGNISFSVESLKSYRRQEVLLVSLLTLSLLVLLYRTRTAHTWSVSQDYRTDLATVAVPVRLIIPVLAIRAVIEPVGVVPSGQMAVPDNTADVGWFKLGPYPGQKGSAVIAGHFDGIHGEPGVFMNLYTLKKADRVSVEYADGRSVGFAVRESRIYPPGYADEVFASTDSAHLNLITCDGLWDGTMKSYTKRLVVFTDIMR